MENWTKRIFLKPFLKSIGLIVASGMSCFVHAEENAGALIKPDVKPVVVDESLIDTENFEIGVFTGVMNIEDFESSFITGARLGFHLSESVALEASIGMTEAGRSSFEKLGNVELLSSDERDYMYYSFGFNFKLPGESYFGSSHAFNNNLYFSLGMGATDFAGDNKLTGIIGVGYQLLMNDWFALQVSAKEHLFKIDVTGEDKMTYNSELAFGASFFF